MSQAQVQVSKSQQALAGRNRFSFGRTFLANLVSGQGHHDTRKLGAFLVAAGYTSFEKVDKMVGTDEKAARQVLNDVAVGVVTMTPVEQLPKNLNLED
jgi:hypothetical protein